MAEPRSGSTTTALHELTAAAAARLVRQRQVSPVDLVRALLERAEQVDGKVQAWETLDAEHALAAARSAEASAPAGLLHGVPFGAKDIVDTAGLRTAAGFQPYDGRVPAEDARVVSSLKHAGAILLGKTVTTQFAYTDPSRTLNPWALGERTPGGSSSGSAAGVAAREFPLAIGSQTAGSVLRPAAYNGVVGFKPTFGRISRKGVIPAAWTLDHIGVLARGVEDCALFFAACAGHDPTDPYSADQPVPPVANVGGAVRPPRLGLVREAVDRSVPRVRTHLEAVAGRFASAGATIREVSLAESWDLAVAVHHLIMQTEMAGVHAELLERHVDAYGPRLRAYVETGRLIPGERYLKALRLRRRVRAAFDHALSGLDALLLPTAVDVAPGMETTGDATLQAPVTLVGLPSISLPSGLTDEEPRLPFAIQLVGHRWDEPGLLAAARWCEERLGPMPAPPL